MWLKRLTAYSVPICSSLTLENIFWKGVQLRVVWTGLETRLNDQFLGKLPFIGKESIKVREINCVIYLKSL